MTTVVIGDDIKQARDRVRREVEAIQGLRVSGEAQSGLELVEMCGKLRPDLVITDLNKPDIDGILCGILIRAGHPTVRLILHTTVYGADNLRLAILAGFANAVPKGESLAATIRQVLENPPPPWNLPAGDTPEGYYSRIQREAHQERLRREWPNLRSQASQRIVDWGLLLRELGWDSLLTEYRKAAPGLLVGNAEEWRAEFDALSPQAQRRRVRLWATARDTEEWQSKTPIQTLLQERATQPASRPLGSRTPQAPEATMPEFDGVAFVQAIDALFARLSQSSPLLSILPSHSFRFQSLIGRNTLLAEVTRKDADIPYPEMTDTSYWLELIIPLLGEWRHRTRGKYPEHLKVVLRLQSEEELSTFSCDARLLAALPWTAEGEREGLFPRWMSILDSDTHELRKTTS